MTSIDLFEATAVGAITVAALAGLAIYTSNKAQIPPSEPEQREPGRYEPPSDDDMDDFSRKGW